MNIDTSSLDGLCNGVRKKMRFHTGSSIARRFDIESALRNRYRHIVILYMIQDERFAGSLAAPMRNDPRLELQPSLTFEVPSRDCGIAGLQDCRIAGLQDWRIVEFYSRSAAHGGVCCSP
jgi:hypothetical protein